MDGGIGDGYLVRRAQAGHVEAFNLLVERHQQGVYRVAMRMVGNQADAQDLAQEAFLRAWRGLGGFRGDSSFSTWLYRIVTTTCLKFLRGPARRKIAVEVTMYRMPIFLWSTVVTQPTSPPAAGLAACREAGTVGCSVVIGPWLSSPCI